MAAAATMIKGNGTAKKAIAANAAMAIATAAGPFSARLETLRSASATMARTAAFNPNRMPCTTARSPSSA
jgi:hypothetical protein